MAAKYTAGIDWAENWLDCAVMDREGRRLGHRRIVYVDTADPVGDFVTLLASASRQWRRIPVAIEDANNLFAEALADRGMTVVPIDPTLVARARKAATVGAETKADVSDAYLLADMVSTGRHTPRPLGPPEARVLQVLARGHTQTVRSRIRAVLHLRSALAVYFPAALHAWPRAGLTYPQARAVLTAAPSPERAAALSRGQLADILRAAGRWRTVDDEAERLSLLFRRPALRTQPAVEEARATAVLGLLADLDHACRRAEESGAALTATFKTHPHHPIATSLPGVGDLLGARIMGEIGTLDAYPDVRSLCAYAGVTPVTWASGTASRTSKRRAANQWLRAALHQAAFCALTRSPGIRAYYSTQRERGVAHNTTLRNVGRRLVRCLYTCLQRQEMYSEARAFPQTDPL